MEHDKEHFRHLLLYFEKKKKLPNRFISEIILKAIAHKKT